MLHKTLEAKATTTTDLGEFTAIAAAYSVDRTNERIIPGAFKGSIAKWAESGKQIPLHWNHSGEAKDIIGTVDPSSMKETDEGLKVAGTLDLEDSEVAREAWRLMKKNAVALSFGYLVLEDAKKDGVRELQALDLFEITITPAPANPDTRFIDMKSVKQMSPEAMAEQMSAMADEMASGDYDEAEMAARMREMAQMMAEMEKSLKPSEDVSAIEDAGDEEPQAKSQAQDPLSKGHDRLQYELLTEGIDMAQSPKVEKTPEPVDTAALQRQFYDLMLHTLTGSEHP